MNRDRGSDTGRAAGKLDKAKGTGREVRGDAEDRLGGDR
jgi:uncharacterized protein YjbJ (UPF0337 family)